MQFYRYWTRSLENIKSPDGKSVEVISYGYSNESLDDALRVARERAEANANQFGKDRPTGQQYYSQGVPLREEVLQELVAADGHKVVISRNKYGCLVLNTPHVFFADIDRPESSQTEGGTAQSVVGFFQNLFGSREESGLEDDATFENEVIAKVEKIIGEFSGMFIRLYRTFNGFRAMIMNETIPCRVAKSHHLLQAFGSDKLYVSLCRSQDCYRARISPKPWRCGLRQHNTRYPFLDEAEKVRFTQWQAEYEKKSSGFATCAFIGNFGYGEIHESCQQVADVHDNYVLNGNLPLA